MFAAQVAAQPTVRPDQVERAKQLLASPNYPPRAIVESGGGAVIRCGDVEDLVGCFGRYAADRALVAEHGHRARASLERSYTRDQLCHRWVQLLESLVSGAGRTA